MKRRGFLRNTITAIGGIALGIEALAADKGIAKPAGKKPNIVLIMSDDQGWGETSYNGHPPRSC
jgi:hypothetical protein